MQQQCWRRNVWAGITTFNSCDFLTAIQAPRVAEKCAPLAHRNCCLKALISCTVADFFFHVATSLGLLCREDFCGYDLAHIMAPLMRIGAPQGFVTKMLHTAAYAASIVLPSEASPVQATVLPVCINQGIRRFNLNLLLDSTIVT